MARRVMVPLGLLITIVLSAGVAFAIIPDADGVIHGCRNKNTGALRVINYPAQHCTSKEVSLDWNQTGPQGPAAPKPILIVNAVRTTIGGGSGWTPLPGASTTINVASTPVTALVRFWASPACFGLDRDKYVRINADGIQLASAPMANIPANSGGQSEIPVMIETSTVLSSPGTHTLGIDGIVAGTSSCVINPGLWHLVVQTYE